LLDVSKAGAHYSELHSQRRRGAGSFDSRC
jgi:hypothetical protein